MSELQLFITDAKTRFPKHIIWNGSLSSLKMLFQHEVSAGNRVRLCAHVFGPFAFPNKRTVLVT